MKFYQYLNCDYYYYVLICANSEEEANDIFEAGMGFTDYEPFEISQEMVVDRMEVLGVNLIVNDLKPKMLEHDVWKIKLVALAVEK